jgi:hypothetical protein
MPASSARAPSRSPSRLRIAANTAGHIGVFGSCSHISWKVAAVSTPRACIHNDVLT